MGDPLQWQERWYSQGPSEGRHYRKASLKNCWMSRSRCGCARGEMRQGYICICRSPESPLCHKWVTFVKSKSRFRVPRWHKRSEDVRLPGRSSYGRWCSGEFSSWGNKNDEKKDIVTKRLASMIVVWKHEDWDVADVFKLLELQKTEDYLFESPLFDKWVAFVESLYPKNLNLTHRVVFKTLEDFYKGDALPNMLVAWIRIEKRKCNMWARYITLAVSWGINVNIIVADNI